MLVVIELRYDKRVGERLAKMDIIDLARCQKSPRFYQATLNDA